jgi:hypothetical protein
MRFLGIGDNCDLAMPFALAIKLHTSLDVLMVPSYIPCGACKSTLPAGGGR